jgi:hypothetical protein
MYGWCKGRTASRISVVKGKKWMRLLRSYKRSYCEILVQKYKELKHKKGGKDERER